MSFGENVSIAPVQDRVTFLKRKVSTLFDRVKNFERALAVGKIESISLIDLEVRLKLIEQAKTDFNLAHNSLEELDYNEIGSKLRDEFDECVVSLEVRVRSKLQRSSNHPPASSTLRHDSSTEQTTIIMASKSRIPELKLPIFSGGYTEYADFSSMFNTIIDNDPDLTSIEKLQHLRSCVQGPALDAIRALEISSDNYAVAVELLKKRFSNKRLVFQAHISEILGLERVESSSAVKLRQFSDKLNAHLRALNTMGKTEEIAGCMIVYMLLQKMDSATQAKWEEHAPIGAIPSAEQFTAFLDARCQKLENVEHATATYAPSNQVGKNNKTNSRSSFMTTKSSGSGCVFCDNSTHSIYSCTLFANLSPSLRLKEAKKLDLCLNCLKKGHQLRTCKSTSCRECGAKHHTLLHLNTSQPPKAQGASSLAYNEPNLHPSLPNKASSNLSTSNSLVAQNLSSDVVLLATAVILVKDHAGSLVPCRALLDSGSQLHLVTSSLAQQLQLKRTKSSASVSGLGDASFNSEGYTVCLNLKSQASDYDANIVALVAPNITDHQPSFSINTADWKIPQNIQLADPQFFRPQRIDLLIGASLFFDLLCVGQIKLAAGLPSLQKTRFGWVVSGGGSQPRRTALVAAQSSPKAQQTHDRVDEMLRSFWEIENCSEFSVDTKQEDLDCEEHFRDHFVRLPSGEFSVRLPVKRNLDMLGDSYTQAYRRFLNLERKLERHPQLKEQYSAFIKEYRKLNHMSLVEPELLNRCLYFLPHHCVLKDDITTTKLRVVFDGSAATSTGFSLNEILMAGPTIQPKLLGTLMRFRTFPVALTGDICKMYRCVRVSEPDSYMQCILWRDSPQEEIELYRLDTVTYGTKPASFHAIRFMPQLAEEEQASFPVGSQVIRHCFYVDDLMTGGADEGEVREILRQTSELLAKGNFQIRKWCSNVPAVLSEVPDKDKETLLRFDDGTDFTKALGLAWDPASDELLFSVSPKQLSLKPTKRSLLSTIARFYDPLGLIAPVITMAKIFLQQLWKEQLQWDESLPASLSSAWLNFCENLSNSQRISFPRLTLVPNSHVEVHGFCDASLHAYGACVYIVSRTNNGTHVQLLCAKSRVAPLKTLTVPKLELCGALLLSQLMNEVLSLQSFAGQFYCWSDSTTALSWIRNDPAQFSVFVSHRVLNIQKLTALMEWHYVPTNLNPADILSRGALPSELLQSQLWSHGPPFLCEEKKEWPSTSVQNMPLLELRKRVLLAVCPYVDLSEGRKFANSFDKLQRTFGYVFKFQQRTKSSGLTVADIFGGTRMLLLSIQRVHLWADYKALLDNKQVSPSSSLASLAPFIDEFGLLRVGGRLRNSSLDFNARHPIILPRRHPVTSALIVNFHERNLHAGPRSLLALIRHLYWPIGGRRTVASVVNSCVRCFRARPRLLEHIMADLPKERVDGSYTFMVTGVDFCGPFFYKSEVRRRPPIKCYICLFICFSTKAVHLELVQDLSTASFLCALKRFIFTRGRPREIWSDNATNFVGAKNELEELKQLFLDSNHLKAIQEFCVADHIDWRFIPPRSPHFGGLWEAAVKTAKHHFYRSAANSLLNFDDLRTLVCHITAIINSRPLLPITEHPDDLDVLTPAHFLGTANMCSFASPDITGLNFNRLDRWQRINHLQQTFWSRWREEYLTLLQQRTKWRTDRPGINVGDIVLVKNENLPPLKWPLARVSKLIVGGDGVARVAELRTATGTTTRAVAKLCLLPKKDVEGPSPPTGGECSAKRLSQS